MIPRLVVDLDEPGIAPDAVVRVATARVAWMDLPVLLRDFPALGEGPDPAARAEAWLLRHAGVISAAQLGPHEVNTPIAGVGAARSALRPPRYGRAVVVPIDAEDGGPGLLDLKGAGVGPGREPRHAHHANGLCDLGEILRDLLLQRLIERILRSARIDVAGVPVYALMELGFDRVEIDGSRTRAGVQVRRAHQRPAHGIELPQPGSAEARVKLVVELVLRRFGITSGHPGSALTLAEHGGSVEAWWGSRSLGPLPRATQAFLRRVARPESWPQTFLGVNIQLTRAASAAPIRAELVDFGQYNVRDRFDGPLLNLTLGPPLGWGGCLWPDDAGFVTPDPLLRLPLALLERPPAADAPGADVIALDGSYRWAFGVARRFAEGELDARGVARELASFEARATAAWPRE